MKTKRGRPAKWKRCPDCNRKKLIADDFYRWNDAGRERVSRYCRECQCKRVRARYAKVMADPYLRDRERQRKRNWEAEERKKARNPTRCKRYRERLKNERPKEYQRQLEDARIRNRQRYDEKGAPVATKRATVVQPGSRLLPAQPLVDFLARADADAWDDADVRSVFRLANEAKASVTLAVADRLITRAGGATANVYPDHYA